jgi:DNA-binding SARP family transcriptional activator
VVAAALAALLAFTAVPAVLVLVVGDPLSGGLGHAWQPLPKGALCILALAAWVAWAACCAQLARAVVVRVRSRDVTAPVGGSVLDRLAVRIAVGVLAFTSIGAPVMLSSGAGASTTPALHAAVLRSTATLFEAPRPTSPTEGAPASPRGAPVGPAQGDLPPAAESVTSHVVQAGDTLWSVAQQHLDDGAAWTELATLNLGRIVGRDARFVDPDQIRAGWRLRLPGGAHADPPRPRDEPTRETTGNATGRSSGERLPELAALGLGSLTCAALARRSARRHRAQRFESDLDLDSQQDEQELSEEAVDADVLLRRFDGVPALRAFEAANCLLHQSLRGRASGPRVLAISVAPEGVTFWLAESDLSAPEPFAATSGGAAWHVGHDDLEHQDSFDPYVPVALPVGSTAEGTWLVCLRPGAVLPVLGEAAPALCRSMHTAVTAWAWSDVVLATDDPHDPRLLAELAADPAVAQELVFFGSPTMLPRGAAARIAVVTTAAVAASDLTVLVDRHGATLHPMGRVVQPHLQSERMARALGDLAERDGPRASDSLIPDHHDRVLHARTHDVERDSAAPMGLEALIPGQVEVRLLTMVPRLEGLCEDLPPNRARRAVELVAYLALHHPDLITSDRLRTRVLGSSDADAASKTLFNTAYAARRAMGVDGNGHPLFPAGTRTGHYQVSPQVTVDVLRAIALAAAAGEQSDADDAIALYRAALDLVEGEPLANALSGYSWWEAEGHGGRIAAVLVDSACSMAVLAVDGGHFELAWWGLERARLVEPYSEALSRAAMQVAAAEGDADRLRLEWRECQRRVDALDPGSSPSSRTESLYGELSRRVAIGRAGDEVAEPAYAPAVRE